ncbi:hypothetical protein MHYP_G00273880 [Metynnis hypsauchen]
MCFCGTTAPEAKATSHSLPQEHTLAAVVRHKRLLRPSARLFKRSSRASRRAGSSAPSCCGVYSEVTAQSRVHGAQPHSNWRGHSDFFTDCAAVASEPGMIARPSLPALQNENLSAFVQVHMKIFDKQRPLTGKISNRMASGGGGRAEVTTPSQTQTSTFVIAAQEDDEGTAENKRSLIDGINTK